MRQILVFNSRFVHPLSDVGMLFKLLKSLLLIMKMKMIKILLFRFVVSIYNNISAYCIVEDGDANNIIIIIINKCFIDMDSE